MRRRILLGLALVLAVALAAALSGSRPAPETRLVLTQPVAAGAAMSAEQQDRLVRRLALLERDLLHHLREPDPQAAADLLERVRALNSESRLLGDLYVGRYHEVFLMEELGLDGQADLSPQERLGYGYFYGRGRDRAVEAVDSTRRLRAIFHLGATDSIGYEDLEAWRQLAGGLYTTMMAESTRERVRTLDLEGKTVAVLGVGTGQELWSIVPAVGPRGRILAVDISAQALDFVDWVRDRVPQFSIVETRLCKPEDTLLPPQSVDAALGNACGVRPSAVPWFRSLRGALRPGGEVHWMAYAAADEEAYRTAFREAGFSAPQVVHGPRDGWVPTLVYRREGLFLEPSRE